MVLRSRLSVGVLGGGGVALAKRGLRAIGGSVDSVDSVDSAKLAIGDSGNKGDPTRDSQAVRFEGIEERDAAGHGASVGRVAMITATNPRHIDRPPQRNAPRVGVTTPN